MAAVTVSRSGGRLIAIKQVGAERAGDVEREANLLKRLDHPGLVRFVDLVETPDGGRTLHTEFVSSDTWATRPLADPAERAAAMAMLAATVADLHHLGVAHLQLASGHVLHGDNDRPVLCSLTLADEATPENRQADMMALADLCHDPPLERGALNGKLAMLADAARSGRLTARELARRLDLLVAKRSSGAESVRAVGGGTLEGLRRRCRPKPLAVLGTVAAAVVGAYALGTWNRSPEPSPFVPATAAQPATNSATVNGSDPAGSQGPADGQHPTVSHGPTDGQHPAEGSDLGGWHQSSGHPAGGSGHTDGQGQPNGSHGAGQSEAGAPDSANGENSGSLPGLLPAEGVAAVSAQEAAAVLEHGGRLYAVGATGDFVVTGDWNCDNQTTAAIVRPSTGQIVLFDAWPEPGETISLPVRWRIGSPTGAEAIPQGQCDLLRVYTTAGSRLLDPRQGPAP